jgi:hypothetical protein
MTKPMKIIPKILLWLAVIISGSSTHVGCGILFVILWIFTNISIWILVLLGIIWYWLGFFIGNFFKGLSDHLDTYEEFE